MLKILKKFCNENNLLFEITDSSPLSPIGYINDVPFVNNTMLERTTPLLQMETCQSIIVFLMPYKVNTFNDKSKPLIASPNQCYDYHNVFINKLETLVSQLNTIEEIETKIFVDTGILMERELARKAGLGYFSKNSNLLNEKLGSSFFIGYIMTNKKFENTSKIIEKNCGSCTICKDNCPTGAINGDYTINHNKCLSYITQKKEILSKDESNAIENKIYGCNICIKVCPNNKNNLYYEEEHIFFDDFTNNTNKEFKEKYHDKGFCWRGNSVLKRNALIAEENSLNHSKTSR